MRHFFRRCTATLSICCVMLIVLCVVLPANMVSAAGGKTYYVAADGNGDGLSQASPMSLFKANGTILNGGDTILFCRGDVFYGSFIPLVYNTSHTNRVEVGAYGNGELPVFSNAKIISSAWTKEGQFYSYDLSKNGKYDGVKNDNANVGFMEDSKGVKHGVRQKDAASCTGEYDFYCSGSKIYVKSSKDPYASLGTLTLNTHENALFRIASNMNIHNIHFRDTGYGIVWAERTSATTQHVRIYDCVFDNIGGNLLGSSSVKGGNAIEFYNYCNDVAVERNIFRDVYDVAFTCQGGDETTIPTWRNITVKENIFITNTQAVEFWSQSKKGGISKLSITDNICLNQGEGWGTDARPNKKAATDVLAYNYYSPAWDMTISNNTFFHTGTQGVAYYMPASTVLLMRQKATIDNNRYYFPTEDSEFARWSEGAGYSFTFAQWQKTLSDINEAGTVTHDSRSTLTAVGNGTAQHIAMLRTAATSVDFNQIVKAVVNAGVFSPIAVSNSAPNAEKTTTSSVSSKPVQSGDTTTNTPISTSTTKQDKSDTSTTVDTIEQPESETQTTKDDAMAGVKPKNDSNMPTVLWIVIASVVVLGAGVAVLLIALNRKKKAGHSVQEEE